MVDADNSRVRVTQAVGPMSATFDLKMRITERDPGGSMQFTAIGRSVRGAAGNVRSTNTVQLEAAEGGGTRVTLDGDLALGGMLGSVGQKVVAKQAGKVTRSFAEALERELTGNGAAEAAPRPRRARPSRRRPPDSRRQLAPAPGAPLRRPPAPGRESRAYRSPRLPRRAPPRRRSSLLLPRAACGHERSDAHRASSCPSSNTTIETEVPEMLRADGRATTRSTRAAPSCTTSTPSRSRRWSARRTAAPPSSPTPAST